MPLLALAGMLSRDRHQDLGQLVHLLDRHVFVAAVVVAPAIEEVGGRDSLFGDEVTVGSPSKGLYIWRQACFIIAV